MSASKLSIRYRPIDKLLPYARNARTHSEAQIAQLAASIREFGWTNPVLIDGDAGIIAGHGRVLAARQLGISSIPCIELAHLSEAQRRAYVLADNQLALQAGWDEELLRIELADLQQQHFDLGLIGFDEAELQRLLAAESSGGGGSSGPSQSEAAQTLAQRFMVAPFSVLNAREGWWQERKRAWIAQGLKSEEGRGENLLRFSDTILDPTGEKRRRAPARSYNDHDWNREKLGAAPAAGNGTSIFDPVLCEIAYRWFCPPGGRVLDPFAGGSCRGIVAAALGRRYSGMDLRAEQIEANRAQWESFAMRRADMPAPDWHCGDSRGIASIGGEFDCILSCPPYADLEVYSDDPRDISHLEYAEFCAAYREIIAASLGMLRADRFAIWVVGDVRDKRGIYRNLIGETIEAFRAAGAQLYNEAILITALGSLAIRVGRQFTASRKLGKTHQQVLVFVKGDGKRATQACGPVEVPDEAIAAAALGSEIAPEAADA